VSKHVAIAYLCQILGVDRRREERRSEVHPPSPKVPV
jgi:hypothetical protein